MPTLKALAHDPDTGSPQRNTSNPSQAPLIQKLRGLAKNVPGPVIGLALICVAMSVMSPYFLTTSNLINVLSQVSYIGMMAVGAALVIILGGIDLSVGSTLALSFMATAFLYQEFGLPFWLAMLAGLALGAFIGLVNGVLITFGHVQPFIATLSTMFAGAGLALYITNGNPITGFPDWFLGLSRFRVIGIPLQVYLMILVFVLAALWLKYRPSGRQLYAIGGNQEVARLSGIGVRLAQTRVYVIAGFLAALAGLAVGARLDSAQPTAGSASDLLSVIAAVVIGGASLSGGIGSMFGTFIGLLIIGVLNNGLTLLNVSPNLQPVVIGVVIILAVISDRRNVPAKT